MNIFYLSDCPYEAARMQCDKHVVKMVLETTQLLCTARNLAELESPYKTTHKNHPCAIWVRESAANYIWLHNHLDALCMEYTVRYGKQHKCSQYLELLRPAVGPIGPMTSFRQCMPEQYRSEDAVQAYRNYYLGEKAYMARWEKGREAPDWWSNALR